MDTYFSKYRPTNGELVFIFGNALLHTFEEGVAGSVKERRRVSRASSTRDPIENTRKIEEDGNFLGSFTGEECNYR